jgi:Concanavalin A-like lectin/glucanases superfamily
MGRLFVADTGRRYDVADVAALRITGNPISCSWWVRRGAATGAWEACWGRGQYGNGVSSGGATYTTIKDSGGEDLRFGATVPVSAAAWMHLAYVRAAPGAGSARFFSNGVLHSAQDTTRILAELGGGLTIGCNVGGSGLPFRGDLAHVAVWADGLTDAEVLALARGVSPTMVRLATLRGYWPLLGNASPEPCIVGPGGANATAVGAALAQSTLEAPGGVWAL